MNTRESIVQYSGNPDCGPSVELNHAFTPLLYAFKDKIDKNDWMRQRKEREPEMTDIMTIVSRDKFPEADGFPNIFSLHDSRMLFLKPSSASGVSLYSPLGQYGESWGKLMVTAGAQLIRAATDKNSEVNIVNEADDTYNEHQEVLEEYTIRGGLDIVDRTKPGNGSLAEVALGFQTVVFAAGVFTNYKVPGYEDNPKKLLRDLAEKSRVFSQFAIFVHPYIIDKIGRSAVAFRPPTIVKGESGDLSIDQEIRRHFILERGLAYNFKDMAINSSLDRAGCPVARRIRGNPDSGVDIAAKLFAECLSV